MFGGIEGIKIGLGEERGTKVRKFVVAWGRD